MEGSHSEQLAALARQWPVGDRIKAGEALEEIEGHPGVQVLLRLMAEAREIAFFRLTRGNTESHAKLAKDLGFVNGLEALPDAIVTLRGLAESARAERQAAAKAADAEREERQ